MRWTSGDVSLVYGETTATTTSATYLVIAANVFTGGSSYKFTFTATNSLGRYDYDTISVRAGRNPWGGNFTVSPTNGTTMVTGFIC